MDAVVQLVREIPLYGIVASALVALLVLAILKRLIQIAAFVVLAIAVFGAFMHFQGSTIPSRSRDNGGTSLRESIKEEGGKLRNDLANAVRDGVREAALEKLSDLQKKDEREASNLNRKVDETRELSRQ